MKKQALVVTAMTLALLACAAAPAMAAGRVSDAVRGCGKAAVQYCCGVVRGHCAGTAGAGSFWVDLDADGVCDNAGAGGQNAWVDADGDGVCDNALSGNGTSWVDENGDGVCDNAGSRQGRAGQFGNGQGKNAQSAGGKGWASWR